VLDGKLFSHLLEFTRKIMKIIRKTKNGERREALLKEYFLTASLIALLKRVGEEAGKAMPGRAPARMPVRIRH
jgi:hypothetical protein